jgi:hypothetical protein
MNGTAMRMAGMGNIARDATRAAAVAIPLAAVGLAAWDPARHGGPPLCPWRALTGVACPGCGMTRAAGALLRGRWSEALHLHPLVLVVAAQVLVGWVIAMRVIRRGTERRRRPPDWVTPVVLGANAIVFVAVWGLRWADGSLPTG